MSRTKPERSAAKKLLKKPKGLLIELDLTKSDFAPEWMTRAFKSNRYVVMINDNAVMPNGVPAIRAMVQRHDDKPLTRHWREMQNIKNELFGKEATAIEYYPPESELMDDANIYWLWVTLSSSE